MDPPSAPSIMARNDSNALTLDDDIHAARRLTTFIWRRYREMGEERLGYRLYETIGVVLNQHPEQKNWTMACLAWDIEYHCKSPRAYHQKAGVSSG